MPPLEGGVFVFKDELARRCVDILEVKRDHVSLFGIISLDKPKTRKEFLT